MTRRVICVFFLQIYRQYTNMRGGNSIFFMSVEAVAFYKDLIFVGQVEGWVLRVPMMRADYT